VTAQLLHRAGLFLGHDLLGAHPSNPHGHYEDEEVLALHREILAANAQDMFVEKGVRLEVEEPHREKMLRFAEERNAEHDLWGFKEPRASLFLEEWKRALPRMKVLIVYRHFAEATRSLARRHAAEISTGRGTAFDRRLWDEPDLALKSWLAYNQALLAFARAHPGDTLTISFDALRSGFPLAEAINRRWNFGLKEVPPEDVLDPATPVEPPDRQRVSDKGLILSVLETWGTLEELDAEARRGSGFEDVDRSSVTAENFYIPADSNLAAENELLSLHTAFLEERLERNEQVQKRLRARLEKSEARSQSARADLELLLKRLTRKPLGPILRRRKSFRELEERYLKDR
jgi:hypothetical protein